MVRSRVRRSRDGGDLEMVEVWGWWRSRDIGSCESRVLGEFCEVLWSLWYRVVSNLGVVRV